MRNQHRQISPIETYARHGNSIPSAERLEKLHRQLADTNVATTMLAVADMCLDLATQAPSELKDVWVDKAETYLDDVHRSSVSLQENGLTESYKKTLPLLALARLKKAELTNWRRAVHGQPLEETYHEYLSAYSNLVPWLIHNPTIKFRIMEFMPILIGARECRKGESMGWYGRLALYREDNRVGNMANHRTNWDTGISVHPDPEGFLTPPIKLQIKSKGGAGRAQEYQRSGVKIMIASSVGMQDVLGVMTGCFVEAGIVTKDDISSIHSSPSEPEQIDEITERMSEKIFTRII